MSAIRWLMEYKRLVVKTILTEEGYFAESALPEDYTGVIALNIDTIFAVILADRAGQIDFISYNPPDIMDSERKTKGPIILGEGGRIIRAKGSGDDASDVSVIAQWEENPNMPAGQKSKAAEMVKVMEAQVGDWVL